jgi:hypothetical protein
MPDGSFGWDEGPDDIGTDYSTDDGAGWDDTDAQPDPRNTAHSNGGGTGTATKEQASKARRLLEAPPYADFMKVSESAEARAYRQRVESMLKAGTLGAIRYGDFRDAAALLHYGPDFAIGCGKLAAADKTAARALDMLSAPDNPYAVFLMTAAPLIAQVFRNNREAIEHIPAGRRQWRQNRAAAKAAAAQQPAVEVSIPFTKRKLRFKLRVRFRPGILFGGIMKNTQDPQTLTDKVFSDPDLLKVLAKQGYRVTRV